jgi:hypothetical protein
VTKEARLARAKECAVYLARIALNMAETINALDHSRTAGLRVFIEGRDPDLVPLARARECDGRELRRINRGGDLFDESGVDA